MFSRFTRFAAVSVAAVVCGSLLLLTGCTGTPATSSGSSTPTSTVGAHMAGPQVDVHLTQAAVDARPKRWDLSTPEKAVRSYLDWTTYAYRTAQSVLATQTMTANEEVRVDSYIQLNIQKGRILDQQLLSIEFSAPSAGTTNTTIPAVEHWTYNYLSIDYGNKVLEGPYTADYDAVYTLVKNTRGEWLVDSVKATPRGTVK